MPTTHDIVQKLWSLCDVLRDDGITYQDYVTELTWLLFLKMAQETNTETQLPEGYRWNDLVSRDGIEQLNFYKKLLLDLGTEGQGRVKSIFADASTSLRQPRNLKKIVDSIDALDWYSARQEGLRSRPFRRCSNSSANPSWRPPSEATSPPTGARSTPTSNRPPSSSTASVPNAAAAGKKPNSPKCRPKAKCRRMRSGRRGIRSRTSLIQVRAAKGIPHCWTWLKLP